MEKGRWRWKWRRVSGEIRMGDRVSGKIRMGDRWVGYKRRKKWAWERILERENLKCLGEFFGEEILDVWESFGRLKKNLRERKYQKRENFEDDGSLNLGVIITNSFIDQHKSRVHPRQRANKFKLSVFIYSFIYGFTRKLAQIVYTFSISISHSNLSTNSSSSSSSLLHIYLPF